MTGALAVHGPVEIVAHRGFSALAPENTLAALERALAAGADALEFDLHTVTDGTPFLFHDDTLERTTDGEGRIRAATPASLADLDAGSWFGAEFTGEPVPSLERVLETLGRRAGKLYPEIKGYVTLDDVDRIVGLFIQAGLLGRTIFISMDWDALDRCRSVASEAFLGYIVEVPARAPEALDRATGDPRCLVDFDARILLTDPNQAERAHSASVPLAAWTVNRVRDAARLLDMGVPRITTNEVASLVAWKAGL